MANLQADDLLDLTRVTLRDLGRLRWTDIATDLQEHIALSQMLRRDRVGFGSGYGIQFTVRPLTSSPAKYLGLYEVDDVDSADVTVQADIPWRHAQTKWSIERREINMNRTPSRIVELIKIKRADAMVHLADILETNFWAVPSVGSTAPFGIDYWVTKSATTGFNGQNAANYSAGPANIDSGTFTRWRNFTAQYTNVTQTDCVRLWREAATKTRFMHPYPNMVREFNTGDRYGYYTNYAVVGRVEELAASQNDRLGFDIAPTDGRTRFRGNPVVYTPQLDNDSQDPIYGINWGIFKPIFLRGEYMVEDGPEKGSNQHTVIRSFIDLTHNYVCYDRRRMFILNTA